MRSTNLFRFIVLLSLVFVLTTICIHFSPFTAYQSTHAATTIHSKESPELNLSDRELKLENSSFSSIPPLTSTIPPLTSTIPPLTPTIPPAYLTLPLLYLVEVEKCLFPYFLSNDVLGNGSLGFEVIVLSYKEACDNPPVRHIQYLLNSDTTWATGRNILFETAMNRNKTYLYYIFFDDDIVLIDLKKANPWRKFEAFLRSVEPAIATIDANDYVKDIRNIHREQHCALEDKEYITCMWYDAIVNAFHHKAVRYILPYDVTYDKENWWTGHMAVIIRSEILFRGQLVFHTEVIGENTKHTTEYPRDINFSQQMFEGWLSGLAERHLPPNRLQCANVLVQRWRTMGRGHGWSSPTLCLPPPPPHDIIEPGRYACA